MIITDEELFAFFQEKVICAVAQIQNNKLRIATGAYRASRDASSAIRREDQVWILPVNKLAAHPLDMFLDNQKVLLDKSRTNAVARRLNCKRACIVSFNEGLQGGKYWEKNKDSMEYRFFMFGRTVRTKYAKKKLRS